MLLFNAETWVSISKSTLDELEDIQKRFYRCILSVGAGCPTPSLYIETGGMLMRNRILLRKLLFLHHLATLPETSLAKEVYNIQNQLNLPGLASECEEFLRDHEIVAVHKFTKFQWKRKIKRIIFDKNKDDLIKMSRRYKKISFDSETDLETRHHFLHDLNVRDARMLFKIRSCMVPSIQMNFPSDKKFTANSWLCVGCNGSLDTQTHVILCNSYETVRTGLNLDHEKDLVKYFQEIVKLRQLAC